MGFSLLGVDEIIQLHAPPMTFISQMLQEIVMSAMLCLAYNMEI